MRISRSWDTVGAQGAAAARMTSAPAPAPRLSPSGGPQGRGAGRALRVARLLLGLAGPALALSALAPLASSPAQAQQILVMVQGQPITSFDVAQRIRIAQLTERQKLSQKQALDALVNDRLKIFTADRYGVTADDAEIDKMYANMASRTGRTPAELTQALAQSGVDARLLKDKMRADYVWSNYVRGRYSSVASVRDSDIFAALNAKGTDSRQAQRTTEFTIRQIVLVVGRTAPASMRSTRLAEANALRQKFNGDCESGVAAAKAMREVVVRDPVVRTGADVSAGLRKILADTPVGGATAPEVTQAGVEMVAVCAKREVIGDSAEKKEIQQELQSKQFDTLSDRLLAEARKAALIEYR